MISGKLFILVVLCTLSFIFAEKMFLYMSDKCEKGETTCKVNKKNPISVKKYKDSEIYCLNGENMLCCDNGFGCQPHLRCPTPKDKEQEICHGKDQLF